MQATLHQALMELLWALRHSTPIEPAERSHFHLLAMVRRHPELRMSEVSRLLGLDLSTVSRHCSELVARGQIERREDPADRRAARLAPTPAGIAALEEVIARKEEILAGAIATWSRQDQEALITLVTRLTDDLNTLSGRTELETA